MSGTPDRATVTGLGYELVEVERAPGRIAARADRPPGGRRRAGAIHQVEDCEGVTRRLQYVLEVEGLPTSGSRISSPGLDRPLKSDADFRRFQGEQVEVTMKLPFWSR